MIWGWRKQRRILETKASSAKRICALFSQYGSTRAIYLFKDNRRPEFEISPTFEGDVICITTLRNNRWGFLLLEWHRLSMLRAKGWDKVLATPEITEEFVIPDENLQMNSCTLKSPFLIDEFGRVSRLLYDFTHTYPKDIQASICQCWLVGNVDDRYQRNDQTGTSIVVNSCQLTTSLSIVCTMNTKVEP